MLTGSLENFSIDDYLTFLFCFDKETKATSKRKYLLGAYSFRGLEPMVIEQRHVSRNGRDLPSWYSSRGHQEEWGGKETGMVQSFDISWPTPSDVPLTRNQVSTKACEGRFPSDNTQIIFSLPTMSGQLSFHLEIRFRRSDKRVAAFIPCCFRSIGRPKWKVGGFNFYFCSILIVVPMKYSSLWNQDLRAERAWSHRSGRITKGNREVSPTFSPSFSEQNNGWLLNTGSEDTLSAPPVAGFITEFPKGHPLSVQPAAEWQQGTWWGHGVLADLGFPLPLPAHSDENQPLCYKLLCAETGLERTAVSGEKPIRTWGLRLPREWLCKRILPKLNHESTAAPGWLLPGEKSHARSYS